MNKRITYMLVIFASVLLLCCLNLNLVAQEKAKAKTKSKEEIVIRQRDGNKEKVTIVVDGDRITVNGKPITEYDGDDIVIRKRNIEQSMTPRVYVQPRVRTNPRVYVNPRIATPPMAFNVPGGNWNFSFNTDDMPGWDKAMLGVITEKEGEGAKITEVMKESAAEKAGLRKGDIITHVDGRKVSDPEELAEAIDDKKPNEEAEITYLRNKKSSKIKIKLGERKTSYSGDFNYRLPRLERDLSESFRHLAPLHDDNFFRWYGGEGRHRLGVRIQETEDSSGVKVLEVEEESVAEKSGVKRDDVITQIDGKKIKDAYSAREAMRESNNKSNYTIRVLRNGTPVNIDVKIPKNLKKADL